MQVDKLKWDLRLKQVTADSKPQMAGKMKGSTFVCTQENDIPPENRHKRCCVPESADTVADEARVSFFNMIKPSQSNSEALKDKETLNEQLEACLPPIPSSNLHRRD